LTGVFLKDEQILELYLAIGGVPYYLKFVEKGLSASQVVSMLCFEASSSLRDEFPRLIQSLFGKGGLHLQILRIISKTHYGMFREDLLKKLSIKSGGGFNTYIEELEAAGFLRTMRSFGKKKSYYYRAIDEYSLFYLNWIEPVSVNGIPNVPKDFWINQRERGEYNAWAGYAYENVCLKHSQEIQKALGLSGRVKEVSSWKIAEKGRPGAQVDLLFDRFDQCVTLCEIKYTKDVFTVDKAYAENLKRKLILFSEQFPKKQIFLALISAQSFKQNIWTDGLIHGSVTLKDLIE